MTALNIYQYTDYREILRAVLIAKKAEAGRAFTFDKLAQACRVQRSYISTVLGGSGHLSADQVFDACQFLGLGDEEYAYASTLHELERSVSPARCKRLSQEMIQRRKKGLATEASLEIDPAAANDAVSWLEFYLDIHAILVHMFLTVPRLQRQPELIRRELGLDAEAFETSLNRIERTGLIKRRGKMVTVAADTFHLSASSPFYPAYRQGMRTASLARMNTHPQTSPYSFSALYSADHETQAKIQSRFIEFVEWAQKYTQSSDPQHVFQMNFDLLRWTSL